MTTSASTIAAALFHVLAVTGASGVAQAVDAPQTMTMKPLHGISFNVGSKRAISYFRNTNGQCRLVLTIGDLPDWDRSVGFISTRFEVTLAAEKTVQFDAPGGSALEFACKAGAESMTVQPVAQVATSRIGH